MTQFAIVKKLTGPAKAVVEVIRGTACGDNCGACEACNYASKIQVEAVNEAAADVGDRVEIETQTARILGVATLFYVVPFILFFIGYAVAASLGLTEGSSILVSFGCFAVGLIAAVVVGRLRRKNPITYRIVKVLEYGESL